jgi:hypothetical protein
VNGIAAHPTVANIIYIAASGGGVWETTDGGMTWTPLTDTQKTLSMGAIAIAPSNPSVLYAGTGTPDNGGDYGRGILISTDGGSTWTLSDPNGIFDRRGVSEIAVDPKNANTAYVATSSCCAKNAINDTSDGIYKTTDGGVTWTNTTSSVFGGPWSSVRIDPTTTGGTAVLYAAAGTDTFVPAATADGVYKSSDGGATWTLLASAPNGASVGRTVVALSKANPAIIYVSVSNPANDNLYKFVRSTDSGKTFADFTSTTPNYLTGQGFFDTTLAVDPTDANVVYAGGSSSTNSLIRGVVTTVSGVTTITWTDIHGTSSNGGSGSNGYSGPHVDHHAAAFDANGKFLDGDDGGIWRLDTFNAATTPATIVWTALNGATPATALAQGIGIQLNNPSVAVVGTQDNGLIRYTGTLDWAEVACGDAGLVRFSQHPKTPMIAYASCNGDTGFFRRSDDSGQNWADVSSNGITDSGSNHNFFSPFAVDPSAEKRVVFGALHAWETKDGGNSWMPLVDPTVGIAGCSTFSCGTFPANIDAIGLAANNPKVIYASAGGHMYVTADNGKIWVQRDLPASVAGNTINSISVFPNDAKRAVAVIGAFTGVDGSGNPNGTVFHTIDRGVTWTNISGAGLPTFGTNGTLPVYSAAFHGNSIKTIYLAADDGVYKTTDTGGTWFRFGEGLPDVQVLDLQLDTNQGFLAAASYGRGIWEIKLPPPTTTTVPNVSGAMNNLVTLKADIKPKGVPGTVTFIVNGAVVPGTATYDSVQGHAELPYIITLGTGKYEIRADFTSSDDTKGGNSGGIGTLTVK